MDKVFGRNPVTELLKSDAQVEKLYVNRELNTPPIQQIMRMAKQKGIIVSACDGKKLDFIVQEMNRESNTIGSKANDLETSKMVVELKSEVENIREQVQNIE